MRWKVNLPTPPKQGDTRVRVRFALLPHRINDTVVWLGQYEQLLVWDEKKIPATIDDQPVSVTISGWHVASEKLIKWQAL